MCQAPSRHHHPAYRVLTQQDMSVHSLAIVCTVRPRMHNRILSREVIVLDIKQATLSLSASALWPRLVL